MESQNRISWLTAITMAMIVLFLDILSVIPLANYVAYGIYLLLFPMWFAIVGAPYRAKSWGWTFGLSIISILPIVSVLPELTFNVVRHILSVWKEDKEHNKQVENARAS